MGALEVPRKVAHITVSYPPADLLYPTVPLTLLTVANLIAAWRDREPRRRWWLGASAISIVERIATFSYFIPTMLWLTGIAHLSEAEVEAALSRWLLLDYGRHVLTLGAWLAALKAFLVAGQAQRLSRRAVVSKQSQSIHCHPEFKFVDAVWSSLERMGG